jgi:hypothetical protein
MSITNVSLVGDLRLAQMISQEIKLLLVDTTNLRNTPFLDFVGSINGMGSDTIRVRKAGLDGYNGFTAFTGTGGAFNEDSAVGDTALTDSHVDVVVKRQALAYSITDMASMTGMGGGDIDPFRIAESIARSYELLFADLTGATINGSFTVSKGTTATAMTLDTWMAAIRGLEEAASYKGAPGPYVAVLHPKQWGELQDSLRNEDNNAFAYAPATFEALAAKGSSYKGSFMGVEIYASSHIENDGTDFSGAIFSSGAIGYATGMPAGLQGAAESMQMGEVLIEMDREANKALTRIVGHAYLGMAVIDADRGVNIISAI